MKTYYLITPVTRQAVLAEARARGSVQYAVSEGDTATGHELNWFRELPSSDGWSQRKASDDRLVVMNIQKEA